jgi:hypothetical protein
MYYFTFGSDGQLFNGGWVRIKADTLMEAQQKFAAHYGGRAWKHERFLNGAFFYSEEQFKQTIMYLDGNNLGYGEHDFIQ